MSDMNTQASKPDDELRQRIVNCFNGDDYVPTRAIENLVQLIQADRQSRTVALETKDMPPEYARVANKNLRRMLWKDDARTVAVDDEGLREQLIKLANTVYMHSNDAAVAVNDIMFGFAQLKEQLLDRIDREVIGADEVEDIDLSKGAKSRWGVRARNRVRSEQRQALTTIKASIKQEGGE